MFADLAFARRIEAAEADLAAAAARVAGSDGSAAVVLPVAGGLAVFARPGAPANKTVGIGLGCALDPAALDAVEEALRERGAPVRVELATLAEPSVAAALTARGYRLEGFEHVLGRSLATFPSVAPGPAGVDLARVSSRDPWKDVLIEGFCHPDESPIPGEEFPRHVLEEALRDFTGVEGLDRYLAHVDGEIAGAASMRIRDGVALLCGASTLPAVRRRGVQGALLAARLADARAAGCDVAVVTTAPASRSQANVIRAGFSLLYVRAILVRPLPTG